MTPDEMVMLATAAQMLPEQVPEFFAYLPGSEITAAAAFLRRLAAAGADADRLCARLERATLGCREKADVEAFRLHDEAVTRRSQP